MIQGSVVLTEIEMELAAMVGIRRRAESKSGLRQDNHGLDHSDFWGMDIEGAAAEMAYCKFRNKYWNASINSFKAGDCGENVQIRSTPLPNGCLIVREEDLDHHYYVLVIGSSPVFRVAGWIHGKEAKKPEFMKSPNGRPAAYFVPQSYLRKFTNPTVK